MLILSRKVGQTIVIPGIATEVRIIAIDGSHVRIGISAPSDISIRRKSADESLVEKRSTAD